MADAGYSSVDFFMLVRGQYRATPIIDVNPSHKRILGQAYQGDFYRSPKWEALSKQRPAVERVSSRLKGQRSLNHHRQAAPQGDGASLHKPACASGWLQTRKSPSHWLRPSEATVRTCYTICGD